MADETKRPTAQDIENADNAVRLLLGSLVTGALKNPATRAENTMAAIRTWAPVLDVIAYAADCLRAEEDAERVPGSIVEHYGVGPEVEAPEGGCPACGAEEVAAMTLRTVYACGSSDYDQRPGTFTPGAECDSRIADSLPTNPPEVETPEDAGDDGPDDADGWIAWEGGECPVYPGAVVECEIRSGVRLVSVARRLWWEHFMEGGDIVRYRLANAEQPDPPSQPPTDPESRVRAMSDEEVEAGLTERGVGAWERHGRHAGTHRRTHLERGFTVITTTGRPVMSDLSNYGERGDTTTPEGRAECSRRLLVHLLREEVARG